MRGRRGQTEVEKKPKKGKNGKTKRVWGGQMRKERSSGDEEKVEDRQKEERVNIRMMEGLEIREKV